MTAKRATLLVTYALLLMAGAVFLMTWEGRSQPNGVLIAVAAFVGWMLGSYVVATAIAAIVGRLGNQGHPRDQL